MIDKACEVFKKRFSHAPELVVIAPGRANLIGEHTDYNDGHVFPIAIDRFTVAAVANRRDRFFQLYTANLDEDYTFDLNRLPEKRPQWVSYVMGVIAEFEEAGFELTGKEMVVYGNIPVGSGLSSSAALEIAAATGVEKLEGLEIDDKEMVNLCRRADHRFVGVKSGPMDQFASRACRGGHAGLLDCRTLEMTHHRLPDKIDFVSIYSGIPRSLAASEYNERQASCQKAVDVLKKADPTIQALRDASPELVASQRSLLGERIYCRAKHVVTEERRVFGLMEAFEKEDLQKVGELLLEGHRSLSRDYEVSLPVLDEMVDWLYRQAGVMGARLTGAGFGGSLICLVDSAVVDLEGMTAGFLERFGQRTPEPPQLWRLRSVDGAKYQPVRRL